MNKISIAIVCFVLAILCLAAIVDAGEFTVDERSLLHLGASGGIGYATGFAVQQVSPNMSVKETTIWGGTACMVPGALKETIVDAHLDWGDMAFNALGCYPGAYCGAKHGRAFYLSRHGDAVVMNYVATFE